MTDVLEAEVATPAETERAKRTLVPLAVPNDGELLDGSEGNDALLEGLNSLEVFTTIFVNIVTDEGRENERTRMFFTTALIPGTPEKIPVYGLKETRKKEREGTYLKLEIFVFNGQERLAAGYIHVTLGPDGLPKEMQLFNNNGHHNVLSAIFAKNIIQVYDHKGQLLQSLAGSKKKRNRKKNHILYEARESNLSNRPVSNIEIETEKAGYGKKRLKEMRFEFLDVSDILAKPQVFFSSFLLVYLNKL